MMRCLSLVMLSLMLVMPVGSARLRSFDVRVIDCSPGQINDSGAVYLDNYDVSTELPPWITSKPASWVKYRWINVDSIDEATVTAFANAFGLHVRLCVCS